MDGFDDGDGQALRDSLNRYISCPTYIITFVRLLYLCLNMSVKVCLSARITVYIIGKNICRNNVGIGQGQIERTMNRPF